jgi:Acetyl-CoA acetyltransferase
VSREVFILGGKRTPMGEYVGALKDVSAIDLGVVASRGALNASGVRPEEIDHTIIGNALQTSGDAIYGARHVALKAGVPFDRPALTVNRLCGSGIQSIISGAQMISLVRLVPASLAVWNQCRKHRTSFAELVQDLHLAREN